LIPNLVLGYFGRGKPRDKVPADWNVGWLFVRDWKEGTEAVLVLINSLATEDRIRSSAKSPGRVSHALRQMLGAARSTGQTIVAADQDDRSRAIVPLHRDCSHS